MPVHDWTRVEDGIYHHFHNEWAATISNALNSGLLPEAYYALIEQHAGPFIADVLTLQAPELPFAEPSSGGGTAVAEAPPHARCKQSTAKMRRLRQTQRTVAIRHISGHRRVALIEIVSPGNKDRASHVTEFVAKSASVLQQWIHLLVVDLLPPGRNDPHGIHGALWRRIAGSRQRYDPPPDEPLTLASYVADEPLDAYINNVAVGGVLPDMPIFLTPERYVNVPLESTYQAAYQGVPAIWRDVLERTPAATST